MKNLRCSTLTTQRFGPNSIKILKKKSFGNMTMTNTKLKMIFFRKTKGIVFNRIKKTKGIVFNRLKKTKGIVLSSLKK
jgi:hypothetical protein